jgi:hypothetical protein
MKENLYRKVGRRYVPVEEAEWDGAFPAAGIWLVQQKRSSREERLILKIGELPSLFPYGSLALDADELTGVLSGAKAGRQSSWADVADVVLKWIARKARKAETR